MSDDQDAVDVGLVLTGELNAFTGIVLRWQGPLVTLAFRYCRDRDRAEDLAQAAFLKAFQHLAQWRGRGRFGSWLYAVATSVYRSEMRKHRWRFLAFDAARSAIQTEVRESDEEAVERELLVRHAVSALPARYRDALLLFYFHGMDIKETARSLGVAGGTVKARLHRGRALLRKQLRRSLGEEYRSDDA